MARDTVQADRLEAVLAGELASEDVSPDLARLATLASSLRDEIELEAPTTAFRAQLRRELLTTPQTPPSMLDDVRGRVRDGAARLRDSLRVAGATAMASTLIGTTGVAAAAQSALPGDMLYGVKGVTEDVRMLFASDGLERGRLHLAFARERLEEVELGVDRLSPDELESALAALDEEAAAGANLLLAERPTAEIQGELTAFTSEVRHRLTEVAPHLPVSVRPATENTFEVLRRIDLQLRGLLVSSSCPTCGASTAEQLLPQVVLPGDGPAATDGCDCTPGTGAEADDGTSVTDGLPTDDPATAPSLDGQFDPSDQDARSGSPDRLSDAVRDTGTLVDDVLDGAGDAVGGTGDRVGDAVEDVGSELGESVGNVTEQLDDTVDDAASTVDDTVDGVGSTVEDTVDDTASTLEDTVDDTLDGGGLLGGS